MMGCGCLPSHLKSCSARWTDNRVVVQPQVNRQAYTLPNDLASAVRMTLQDWRTGGKVRRLWARDATLWTGTDEADWLGWVGIAGGQLAHTGHPPRIAQEVEGAGVTDAAA